MDRLRPRSAVPGRYRLGVRFTADQAAAATDGTVMGEPAFFDGVTIDSREAKPGQLFVPVVAERDGHDFISAARDAGAEMCLIDSAHDPVDDFTAVQVADTLDALTALGKTARERLTGAVVGVTGSVGKTSTKDLLRGVLAQAGPTHANVRSFNNEMGVPLTLLNAPDEAKSVVVEMGARGVGHIAHLCGVARPNIGIVTAVAAVHTSEFGDIETVALAKGELVEAVGANFGEDGWAVLNIEDARVAAMESRTAASVITYGRVGHGPSADVAADQITMDDELRPSFRLITPAGEAPVQLAVRGEHNVSNALAAAAAGHIAGLTPDAIATGLADAGLSPWRMEMLRTPAGAIILNDTYNANPLSMAAGLQALTRLDGRRRVAVLGVMAELGDLHDGEHAAVARLAASLDVEVLAYQEGAYGAPVVGSIDEAVAALGPLGEGDAVLLKGSRVAGLENLAQALMD